MFRRYIGIGFSGPKVPLNRLPGWEPDSWAYHGDDGLMFCCTSQGKDYGPKYSTMDTIGCGINFRTGCAFFTKNGNHLGLSPVLGRDTNKATKKIYRNRIQRRKEGQALSIGWNEETRRAPQSELWSDSFRLRHRRGDGGEKFNCGSDEQNLTSVIERERVNPPRPPEEGYIIPLSSKGRDHPRSETHRPVSRP